MCGLTLNSYRWLVGINEGQQEVFIKGDNVPAQYLSAYRFAEIMTDEEVETLTRLPQWNGSNSWEFTVLPSMSRPRSSVLYERTSLRTMRTPLVETL